MNDQTLIALHRWAADRRSEAFRWGETDCCILACEAAELLTGRLVADEHRCKYASQAEAVTYMREACPNLILERLGFRRRARGFCDGDIVTAPCPELPAFDQACHIVLGRYALTSTPEHGVGFVRTRDALELPGAICWQPPCPPQSH